MKNVNIGLFGFGVVGEGIYKVLSQKPQLGAEIKKVIIKQPAKKEMLPHHYSHQYLRMYSMTVTLT